MSAGDLTKILLGIAERTASIPGPETYVGDDGLRHCTVCNGKREHRISANTELQGLLVPCICPCMASAQKADRERQNERERALRVQALMQLGFSTADMAAYRFDLDENPDTKNGKAVRKYVENFDRYRQKGMGLMLCGEYGTGKTFYAGCIVNALVERGVPAMFTNLSRLVNQIQAKDFSERQEFMDELSRLELIAFDDFGVERETEFMLEQMELLIDQFYRAKVPLIVTSNKGPKQLVAEADLRHGRMYDRILERCCPIDFGVGSKRIAKRKANYADMRQELGV